MVTKALQSLRRLFGKNRETTLEEAIAKFAASPAKWFFYRGEPLVWPEHDKESSLPIYPDDLWVWVEGHTLGFIENVVCHGKTATIGHIAVEEGLSRRGVGPMLAKAYARELAQRYGVERIVFSESHSQFHEAGYPGFFARIGATALPVDPRKQRPDRPDFEWQEANW